MEWTFPWASSFGSDFNPDFSVGFTEQQQRDGIEYNYRREQPWNRGSDGTTDIAAMAGTDPATFTREEAGGQRIRARRRRRLSHVFCVFARRTASGACINGSIGPLAVATSRACGGAARRVRQAVTLTLIVQARAPEKALAVRVGSARAISARGVPRRSPRPRDQVVEQLSGAMVTHERRRLAGPERDRIESSLRTARSRSAPTSCPCNG